MADKIRGLEFVATALGGKITNRIESNQIEQAIDRRPPQSGCDIFICFWAKAQHFGYVRQGSSSLPRIYNDDSRQ